MSAVRCATLGALLILPLVPLRDMRAQSDTTIDRPGNSARTVGSFQRGELSARLGLMGTGLLSRVSPALGGETLTEAYLTQPNLMGDVRWRRITVTGTLNLEAFTLDRGELTPGIYGEGYVDRRHPHTLAHEAMITLAAPPLTGLHVETSLSLGKGFVPFGTDDPMMRPFAKYPVNHHHAQILERAVIMGAMRLSAGARDVTVEAGVFNGDEPVTPYSTPQWSRLGDSRAARITVRPFQVVELQGSAAHVTSPDIIQGGAADHDQRSVSLRMDRGDTHSAWRYLLVEYARTDESERGRRGFRFHSVLAEGLAVWRGYTAAARVERTDRPEKERLLDPFRTPAGHIDFQLLGITRWNTASVQLGGRPINPRGVLGDVRVIPFVEVARAVPTAVIRPTVFEPAEFYGGSTLWALSFGVRMHVGTMRARMGRYGVALPPSQKTRGTEHRH